MFALLLTIPAAMMHAQKPHASDWRTATQHELDAAIPDRAPVVNERVETERTSMSGVVDRAGHTIAAAVLITAGYSANGKYSEYFVAQVPLEIGGVKLAPGRYLLGWTRAESGLAVTVSQASDGKQIAQVTATQRPEIKRVEQVKIWPPSPDGMVQLGRFGFAFRVLPPE